ncbi:conserved membrane hypothetical protein [Parafrankia sp. Ea1.12]|uniref:hypothetical protein n=1 Tax=Parafrankia sp. Ea1.12 TaxID=573499 RepID=UPI000DA54D7B|nr:hypothetical protein [Parafrankia sp. Ea1.12]SQD96344.1 conserved membrane hypothetical protein [Parafrankia sp. Ea1.12]
MKFRTLGVALVAGGGLALAALPASPAAAFDDKPDRKPYPPVHCSGPIGEGTVSKSVLLVGEAAVFSGCGFWPGSRVNIELNGVYKTTTQANGSGAFSVPITFPTAGTQTLAGIGQTARHTAATSPAGILPDPTLSDEPLVEETDPETLEPDLTLSDESLVEETDPETLEPDQIASPVAADPSQLGLASELAPPRGPHKDTRIVTATVLVIGLGQGGITGLPFDPALVGNWISHGGGWGLGDHDRDDSCFGDGFDKDRDRVDGARDDKFDERRDDKFDGERRDGLAAPVATPLADGWDDKDGWNDKDDRHRDGDCIIAGGVVGVGGVGGVGAGAGAGGAGGAGGALPFTGVETGAMASIAVALLGGGVLLRVAARRRRLAGRAQG